MLDKGRYKRDLLNIGQRYFQPQGTGWTEVSGVRMPGLDSAEVHTIYLRANAPVNVGGEAGQWTDAGAECRNGRIEALKRSGRAGKVRWQVPAASGLVCWGVAEESKTGVIVDNLSLRGSSGVTLAEIPQRNLNELHSVRPYDLIVLQFGLNIGE